MAAVPIGFVMLQAFFVTLLFYPLVKVISADPYDVRFRSVFLVCIVNTILVTATHVFSYCAIVYNQDIALAIRCFVCGYGIAAVFFIVLLGKFCQISLWQTLGAGVQFIYVKAFLAGIQMLIIGIFFWDIFLKIANPDVDTQQMDPMERLKDYREFLEK